MRGEALPLISVTGSPYERGRQHGQQCGDLIARYPAVLLETLGLEGDWRGLDASRQKIDKDALLSRAMAFLPSLQRFAPHLVEEVRGIADGAKLPFAHALLVNVRAEVVGASVADAQCTAFAVGRAASAEGRVLSGQTLDQHPLNRELLIVLRVEPNGGPAMLMQSFAGLVGYPGLNDRGVTAIAEPEDGRLHVAAGNACEAAFYTYSLGKSCEIL
jgi:isopenicillin-N N-acyltransferase-like protein